MKYFIFIYNIIMDISLKKIKENDFLDIYNLTKDYKIMKLQDLL